MIKDYKRWIVLLLVSSMLFLIVVDVTVLYTALPRLTHDLNASASEKLWIMNAYPLIVAGLLPAAGMLTDRIGHKALFISGLPLFAIASLCAAYSPSATSLIISRGFLAVGAAMSMPATLSIVRQVFTHPQERAVAIGIWSAVASGGAALGPLIGGLLLNHFWWGSVFLINVPIVLLVLPFSIWLIPHFSGQRQHKIDYLSSILILIGLVSAIYTLKEIGKAYTQWNEVIIATLIAIIFLTLFARRQRRQTHPMIDFSLFKKRYFSVGVAMSTLSMVIIVGIEFLLSQRLQLVAGFTPLNAALVILPIPIGSVLASPLAGFWLARLGAVRLIIIGFALTLMGNLWLIAISNSPIMLMGSLFLIGFGLGIIFTTASTSIMLSVDDKQAGMAASIEDIAYELGSVIGVTFMGSLMSTLYTLKLTLPDTLNVNSVVYDSLDEALIVAEKLPEAAATLLIARANSAFEYAFSIVLIATAIVTTISLIALPYCLRNAVRENKPSH
ncbi:MFS transporter [Proteus mirabilis]|uniref:MFS transporter n=1 Tax=Proteus mirabilis TaxID=584 RepID=UPI001B90988D|nr:MFS transporter [Proteus mirabilis]MDC9764218.1 MFS transporter [Proteus mirabilis]HBC7478369.1 MFS transporter [Proteus mirabilis]HCR4047735.1 MFS transporter [Proteus mirabilis]HCU0912734.1 MFS transporter [Proteus mirabilis]